MCKTEGIQGMFAVEGLYQSSRNGVARGSLRKHKKSHLSGANGVKNQVNNRNFKITALMSCKDFWVIKITLASLHLCQGLDFQTDYYNFFIWKNSRDYDNFNGPMRHRVFSLL